MPIPAGSSSGATPATSGPCEVWPVIWSCTDLLSVASVTGTALEAATEVLYALSGRQFDNCQIEVWPCRKSCYGTTWPWSSWQTWVSGSYPQPALIGGQWFNLTCGQCVDDCSCSPLSQVKLPTPVKNIVDVVMDGVSLIPNADYRLDDGRFLTRLGGEDWPLCNDLSQTSGEGTWSVTIEYGLDVPVMGQMAVGELAYQFALAMSCNDSCQLPYNIQSLARQGVNLTFLDPTSLFGDGRIGLYFSDLFIATVNPKKKMSRSRVYDLDNMPPRRLGT